MKAHFELKNILHNIDGEAYKSYKSIEGEYLFNDYTLYIDDVQGNPTASPSSLRVKIAQSVALFPRDTYTNRSREIALRDFITRKFHESIQLYSKESQMSGLISIDTPGQEILERTTAFIDQSFVEIRFTIDLPTSEKVVAGHLAKDIFFEKLPKIINNSLFFDNLDKDALYKHIETSEDADFLRNELENLKLIAFVAENSILPRQSGTSSLPIESGAVPFISPDTLKMDVELPNKGQITGMGILRGITLIVGENNHGKSTLLKAIEQGIYNHIPGDGREYVVSNPNSVKVSAEDGRSIQNVDLSPFIKNLSAGQKTDFYSVENASAGISQAVNIIEAVEVGADVLLIDENTSANNFLYHNSNSRENASEKYEYITPYIDNARNLYNEYMVSSILVIGHSEDYFGIADFVIQMTDFKAQNMTQEATEIAHQRSDVQKIDSYFGTIRDRIPLAESLDSSKGKDGIEIPPNEISDIEFGSNLIDLSSIEQIVSISQINAIRDAIQYAKKYMDGKKSFRQVTSLVMLDIGRSGLDILTPRLSGNYAEFRKIELAAAINRLRTLRVEQKM
ncbi:MAG: ATPase [Thermodesulfobacteriales bacterium]|nr:MAG: ATPase [Thermodesulfobacteriales bacterium]